MEETEKQEKRIANELCAACTGSGRPVLLIHGILCDHTFFDGLVSALQASFRLITYDRRGYGLNGKRAENYSVDTQAEDAFRALQYCGLDRAVVVGHSAGARVALALALRHPEAVEGLFLMEPAIGLADEGFADIREWNTELNGYANAHKAGEINRAFARITAADTCKKSRPVSLTKEKLLRAKQNVENFAYGELNAIQLWRPDPDALRHIACPVSIGVSVHGRDTLFGRVTLQDARCMNWPVIEMPGGHTSMQERPEECAQILRRQVLEQ